MNSKHIAAGIVAVLIAVLIQSTLWVKNKKTAMQKDASAQEREEVAATKLLTEDGRKLGELKNSSSQLIEFLQTWQPHFEAINTSQSAEVNFTMKIKEDNLINLAQRFEPVALKGNTSIPSAMRAYVTFEDDYVRLLNWLGGIEQQMPTVRVNNLRLIKGTRANDLRMEVTLEQPLLKK